MCSDLQTHYEALGIGPRATRQQVEKAYQFFQAMYQEGALATYSLLEPEDIGRARVRIEEAYEVLRDPARRRDYDLALGLTTVEEPLLPFEAEAPGREVEAPEARGPVPPAPEVLPDPVAGGDLRQHREKKGVTLREIAAKSKVGVRYLEYIEEDRHAFLPADVYLRGFLREYAKAVGLDPRATAESYLAGRAR